MQGAATTPASGPYTGHRYTPEAAMEGRQQAAKMLLQMLGLGAVAGAGVRGARGLSEMFSPQKYPVQHSAQLPQVMPLHRLSDEREKRSPGEGLLDRLSRFIAEKNLIPTPHTTHPLLNDWGIPAGLGVLGAGAYGGYKGVDALLGNEKRRSAQSKVDAAERDYRNALAEQYRAAMQAKAASADPDTSEDLGTHALAEAYVAATASQAADQPGKEKQASPSIPSYFYPDIDKPYIYALNKLAPGSGYDALHALKGAINAGIGALALGTGAATYSWTKGKNEQEILRRALQLRQQQRRALSPPPLVAVPEGDNEDGK